MVKHERGLLDGRAYELAKVNDTGSIDGHRGRAASSTYLADLAPCL